jgi:hypothetical protein
MPSPSQKQYVHDYVIAESLHLPRWSSMRLFNGHEQCNLDPILAFQFLQVDYILAFYVHQNNYLPVEAVIS